MCDRRLFFAFREIVFLPFGKFVVCVDDVKTCNDMFLDEFFRSNWISNSFVLSSFSTVKGGPHIAHIYCDRRSQLSMYLGSNSDRPTDRPTVDTGVTLDVTQSRKFLIRKNTLRVGSKVVFSNGLRVREIDWRWFQPLGR